ncbi:hypothetical protein HDU80_006134 [Chytriomyces hyalinus]|nr:hypothetical protein HDU80_006134 [Chytriomyces hyalinus]
MNALTGTLPDIFGDMAELQPIPESLARCSKLQKLRMNFSQFSGAAPEVLYRLAFLRRVDLRQNLVTDVSTFQMGKVGPTPRQDDSAAVSALTVIDLAFNCVTGTICGVSSKISSSSSSDGIPSFSIFIAKLLSGGIQSSLTNLQQLELEHTTTSTVRYQQTLEL